LSRSRVESESDIDGDIVPVLVLDLRPANALWQSKHQFTGFTRDKA
jgi:hypothetical protein